MSNNLPGPIRRLLQRADDHEAGRVTGADINEIADKTLEALAQSRELLARTDKLLSRR
jgi:hypothetical protein